MTEGRRLPELPSEALAGGAVTAPAGRHPAVAKLPAEVREALESWEICNTPGSLYRHLADALPVYEARLRAEWEAEQQAILESAVGAEHRPAPDLEAALAEALPCESGTPGMPNSCAFGHHQRCPASYRAAVLPLLAAERARAEKLQKRFDLIDHPLPVEGNPSTDDLIRWSREAAANHDDWAEHYRQNADDHRSEITGDAEWNRHHGNMHRAVAERLEELQGLESAADQLAALLRAAGVEPTP